MFLLYSAVVLGQVGIGTQQPDPSAILDVKSSDKGVLLPRLSTLQRTAIANPENGLQVYDIDAKCLMIYKNNRWECYPGEEEMNSRIAAILTFNDITSIGGANNASAVSTGVTINYNPDSILENLGSGVVRFLRPAKYEITMSGIIHRGDGINVVQNVEFGQVLGLVSALCTREAPGSYPSDINYFCKNVLDIYQGNTYNFSYTKYSQGTPNTTSISVVKPMIIIKYIDLY